VRAAGREVRNPEAYLIGIARKVLAEHNRGWVRQRRVCAVETPAHPGPALAQEPSVLADLTLSLQKWLAERSNLDRAVFFRLVVLGESHTEAARSLGLTTQQFRTRLARLQSGLAPLLGRKRPRKQPTKTNRKSLEHRLPRQEDGGVIANGRPRNGR
jgi:DNA-directed RNA polymerase specialized sigma24 family protein